MILNKLLDHLRKKRYCTEGFKIQNALFTTYSWVVCSSFKLLANKSVLFDLR